ncbi:glutathione S-transferase family protein [Propionibacterium freudenreichii]
MSTKSTTVGFQLAAPEASHIATSENAHEIGAHGEFSRQDNAFTTPFGDGPGQLPVEAGRYRLIVARICPWAHRQLITREVLGLTDAISVGVTVPVRTDNGWRFSLDPGDKDPVLGIEYLNEAYLAADPGYDRRGTVPAVVDVTTGKVVQNDYHRLSNYWEVAWRRLQPDDAPDLYPSSLRPAIDEMSRLNFHAVNNGVYKAGFAHTQEAYEQAFDALFARLDALEQLLGQQRFLLGEHITDSDVRLFPTLVRFDTAYYVAFRTNRNRLIDFPNLWNYARELYALPGWGSTTDFQAIKLGYFGSTNVTGAARVIIPKGPDLSGWDQASTRAEQFGDGDVYLRH